MSNIRLDTIGYYPAYRSRHLGLKKMEPMVGLEPTTR